MPNTTSSSDQAKGWRTPPDPPRLNVVSVILVLTVFGLGLAFTVLMSHALGVILGGVLAFLAALSPKVAKQWERAVILRLGNYTGLRGPGLFWIIPGIDQVSSWIDQRIITTSFAAEQTLTTHARRPPSHRSRVARSTASMNSAVSARSM